MQGLGPDVTLQTPLQQQAPPLAIPRAGPGDGLLSTPRLGMRPLSSSSRMNPRKPRTDSLSNRLAGSLGRASSPSREESVATSISVRGDEMSSPAGIVAPRS